MIKVGQNQLILFTLALLVIGVLLGVIAVKSTNDPTSRAAEYEIGSYSGSQAQPSSFSDCFNRCRRGGGGLFSCAAGCIAE